MRAPAIQFPETPEHPATVNAELQYRLDFLRMIDYATVQAEKAQQNSPTPALTRAGRWIHEWLIKGARVSIEDLGPLSSHAQKTEMKEFVKSLTH